MSAEKQAEKLLVGVYDDDDKVIEAVKEIRGAHVEIDNVYTPFPLHGLDYAMGLRESRLPTVAFFMGALGTTLALTMMTYMYAIDWQVNVGGKPIFPLPAFIPITFELTVLIASLGMVGAYLIANRLKPGNKPRIIDPRQTDDLFIVTVKASDNNSENDNVRKLFQKTGAMDVREHVVE